MASSDGIDKCLLHRGRSQSDPNILSESGIDLSHSAGKMMHLLSGDAIRNKRFFISTRDGGESGSIICANSLLFHLNVVCCTIEINQITPHLMLCLYPVEMHLGTIVIFPYGSVL